MQSYLKIRFPVNNLPWEPTAYLCLLLPTVSCGGFILTSFNWIWLIFVSPVQKVFSFLTVFSVFWPVQKGNWFPVFQLALKLPCCVRWITTTNPWLGIMSAYFFSLLSIWKPFLKEILYQTVFIQYIVCWHMTPRTAIVFLMTTLVTPLFPLAKVPLF